VDNGKTRRILDTTNTNVLLNAGLGASREDAGFVLWTRHAGNLSTLSQLYSAAEGDAHQDEILPEELDECSRIAYRGVSLSMPFAALAAGSLLAASLYSNATGETSSVRYLQIDLFGKQQRMRNIRNNLEIFEWAKK
jgi:hypothetical protein